MARKYEVIKKKERLLFKSLSFKTERSFLQPGVFSKELASSFIAGSAVLVYLILISHFYGLSLIHYIVSAIIFATVFPLVRIFLFRDSYIQLTIDKKDRTIELLIKRPLLSRSMRKPLEVLDTLEVEHIKYEPENPDAVKFVEKIALQHGTVIPDFGKTVEYFNLILWIDGRKITLLTSTKREEIEEVQRDIKGFLENK